MVGSIVSVEHSAKARRCWPPLDSKRPPKTPKTDSFLGSPRQEDKPLELSAMVIFPKRNLPDLLEGKVDAHARAIKHLPHLALREARVVHAVARRGLHLALRKVDEEERPAGAQPLHQPRDGERRVVEVVEPHPHARGVEAEKPRAGEPCRRWVGREEQVPYMRDPRLGVGSLESCQRGGAQTTQANQS